MNRIVAIVLLVLTATSVGCRRRTVSLRPPQTVPSAIEIHVPKAQASITLDGELEEETWLTSARTGAFRNGKSEARPYSDARFLHRDGTLYIGLYAADEDIHSSIRDHDGPLWLDDAFHLVFGNGPFTTIDVSPRGTVTDAHGPTLDRLQYAFETHPSLATDTDGTIDDSRDEDEEWVVELAVPLAALGAVTTNGGSHVPLSIRRCDRPKNAQRTCGEVSVILVLD